MRAFDVLVLVCSAGSLAVAGWAAWTAHRARLWQERRDDERGATVVTVQAEHFVMAPSVARWDGAGRPVRQRKLYGLAVTVTNQGESPEYVTRIALEPPAGRDGRGWSFATFGPGCEVRPRGRLVEHRQLGALPFDDSGGFVVVAELASGLRVSSTVQDRSAYVAETVARDNQQALRS